METVSKVSPPATSRKHWSHCSARTPAGFRPRLSGDSKRPGRTSMCAGASEIRPPSVTSTSGPTASTSRLAWRTKPSACSSSSGPRRRARRSSSASSTACARAPNPGGRCCSTRSAPGWPLRPHCRLPRGRDSKAKRARQEIWMAETKKDALTAFDAFVETWRVKYDKAVECLIKDREALLAFYDFPAEHWKHLRTTNVIESSFATVRHCTVRSKGCLSNKTALAMIFKLAEAAEKSWRRIDGHSQLPKLILGVKFADGIEVVKSQHQAAAA